MALPCALFSSSCAHFKPQELVKQILKASELPQPKVVSESIESYEWFIETKYYSATVHLCTTENRTIGDQEFAESVQAFIHYFDPNVPSSFELAKAWLPYLSHIEPDVLMLVCNTSKHEDAVGRGAALEWCIQNGFELVELDPEKCSENEDDDFPETTGITRIIQALHAHTWPNLDMKDSPRIQSPYLRQMMKEQHLLNLQQNQTEGRQSSHEHSNEQSQSAHVDSSKDQSSSCTNESSVHHEPLASSAMSDRQPDSGINFLRTESDECLSQQSEKSSYASADATELLQFENIDWSSLLGKDAKTKEDVPLKEDEMGVDEFEQLFMKLKVMKDKAENLPPEERKKYAEKMAISFWKAIGGEEDEIEGLGLDDDSD